MVKNGYNSCSYPGYEEFTLKGLLGKNVALYENTERKVLVYLYETKYGYEEDAYYFNYDYQLAATGSWFPLEDHPDYAKYYADCPERGVVMAADLLDLYWDGPYEHPNYPVEDDTADTVGTAV